jgi:Flp pilus assembly pilin Flp
MVLGGRVREFFSDERGTDLVEYTLLLAFIALASAAVYIGIAQSTTGIWSVTNTRLTSAAGNGS